MRSTCAASHAPAPKPGAAMPIRALFRCVAALSAIALSACGDWCIGCADPLERASKQGTPYVLVLLDGRPLPATFSLGTGASLRVAADTLRFRGRTRTYTQHMIGDIMWNGSLLPVRPDAP